MNWIAEFKKYSESEAFIIDGVSISYAQLIAAIVNAKDQLAFCKTGETLAIIGQYDLQSIALLLAALELNLIVAPLDSESLSQFPNLFFNAIITIKSNQISIEKQRQNTFEHVLLKELRLRSHSGLIYLTSGTGGEPKIVLHDFNLFFNKMIRPSVSHRAILYLKFNHFGGFNTFLPILVKGGTLIVPKTKYPLDVFENIQKFKVTLLPTTPSFLAMALAFKANQKFDLSSLKIISYGAEPMNPSILEAWFQSCPGITFHQTYGMTETGTLKTRGKTSSSLLIKITEENALFRIRDEMLEMKLPYLMMGYLNAETPLTKDGWFCTGDYALIEDNYIKVIGRQSELIYVSGEKVSPHEIENIVSKIPGVIAVKVYGRESLVTQQIVVADVYTSTELQNENFVRDIKHKCMELLPFYKVPMEINFYNPIEHDEVKKIRRTKK